jgi:hypothetical protein
MSMHYPQNEKLEMIQEYHAKQAPTIIASKTSPSSYLNKAVISLDYIQMGNVVRVEINLVYLAAKLSQLITQKPIILS